MLGDGIELDYAFHNMRVFRNFFYNVYEGISFQPVHGGPAYTDAGGKECIYENLKQFASDVGYEKNGIEVDYSIFVKAVLPSGKDTPLPALDLRLKSDSVAIDAGCILPNLNDGFSGKAPDLGAYEAGQPLPHYGSRLAGYHSLDL